MYVLWKMPTLPSEPTVRLNLCHAGRCGSSGSWRSAPDPRRSASTGRARARAEGAELRAVTLELCLEVPKVPRLSGDPVGVLGQHCVHSAARDNLQNVVYARAV